MADAPIQAHGMTVGSLFSDRRFGVTYYQREYSWSRRDVKTLLADLHRRFIEQWDELHDRRRAQDYAPYFLGSIVYYEDGGITRIVDGQQRITTLHLLLIFIRRLLHEQGSHDDASHLETLIWSRRGGRRFAIDVDEHSYILRAYMEGRQVDLRDGARPSERYLLARSIDIEEDFPLDLRGEALEAFVDWLLDRVCLAGIRAADRDHGWEIFETTNDRGERLGPVDLLKSHLLSKAEVGRDKLNDKWRTMLSRLTEHDSKTPSEFVKAFLIARYADPSDAAERKHITEAFHEWVRLNPGRLDLGKAPSYEEFVRERLVPTGEFYATLTRAAHNVVAGWEPVFYNELNQVPYHLTAILAATRPEDTRGGLHQKSLLVANFLDSLYVRRLVNKKVTDASRLEDEILALLPRLRLCQDIEAVRGMLSDEVSELGDDFGGMSTYGLTPTNKAQVRYLLARLTSYAEVAIGEPNRFYEYVAKQDERRGSTRVYEIEHIWADDFERYRRETNGDRRSFNSWRNRLGALLLLQKQDNASYGALPYIQKVETYLRQNLLAASLNPTYRKNHPRFNKFVNQHNLAQLFRAFPEEFGKEAIDSRQLLYQRLCELVWDPLTLGLATPDSPERTKRSTRPRPKQAGRGLTLARLIDLGMLRPNDALVGITKRPPAQYEARVLDDGRIEVSTGEVFPDPSQAESFVRGSRSSRGWEFWRVVRNGSRTTLKEIRTRAQDSAEAR